MAIMAQRLVANIEAVRFEYLKVDFVSFFKSGIYIY